MVLLSTRVITRYGVGINTVADQVEHRSGQLRIGAIAARYDSIPLAEIAVAQRALVGTTDKQIGTNSNYQYYNSSTESLQILGQFEWQIWC